MLFSLFTALSSFIHMVLGISSHDQFPPPLSSEKEKEYFIKKENGDEEARKELILHNLRLVSHIVRKYYASAKNQEDLVSIGTVGLIKAVDTFKIAAGARFATYAARCIQNEILMHFRSRKKTACEVSINEAIDTDKEGNPRTYGDIISVEDTIADDLDTAIRSDAAKKIILRRLDPRARRVICLRYGLFGNDAMTQREVAERMGISRSYVSRIEKAALEEIGDHISDYPL